MCIRDSAEEVLNSDHYGLEKIKERILEFLAVRRLVKNLSLIHIWRAAWAPT